MMTFIISFYIDQVMEAIKASFETPKDLQCFGHKNVKEIFTDPKCNNSVKQQSIAELCYNKNSSCVKKHITRT